MMKIDVHADDFGESLHASEDILDCIRDGKLNSISILSNMSCFEDCVRLYREQEPLFAAKPLLSVHINIMEGSCLSRAEELPDLVDGEGHFCVSWEKLFLKSFLPGRGKIQKQLKKEIKAQVTAVMEAFPECMPLRLDSHQHTHMIPIVAQALFEVIREEGWEVSYIRNAKEPLRPFLQEVSLYRSYRPVNLVKNLILNFCSFLLEGRLRKAGMEPMYLWGLVMSGCMDEKRVDKLLPRFVKLARKKGRTLEVLFHPGHVLTEEITPEFSQEDAIAFHVSQNRCIEKNAVYKVQAENIRESR